MYYSDAIRQDLIGRLWNANILEGTPAHERLINMINVFETETEQQYERIINTIEAESNIEDIDITYKRTTERINKRFDI